MSNLKGFSVCVQPGNYTHSQDREHVITPQSLLVAFVPLADTPYPPPRFSDTSISGRGGVDRVT